MAIYVSKKRCDAYGINSYTADTEQDLPNLPVNGNPGSKAIILQTGKKYMLNNSHQWIEISGGIDPGGDVILVYDGGSVAGY